MGNIADNGEVSSATCNGTDLIFEGGFDVLSTDADIISTLYDGPSLTSPSTYEAQLLGTTCSGCGNGIPTLTFQAFGYCLTNENGGDDGTGV